jgi:hypothetical protein
MDFQTVKPEKVCFSPGKTNPLYFRAEFDDQNF